MELGCDVDTEDILRCWFDSDFHVNEDVVDQVNRWALRGVRIVLVTNQEHRRAASGKQQESLLEALLTLARGQTGVERRAPFDLAAITEQVIIARRAEMLRAGVEINSALAPARVTGDARLVERLVANLVENAIRYNIDHGQAAVTTETEDGRARLSVVNTGPIVPVEDLERLVQPFERPGSDRMGHGEGFGLGLSIVQAIAEAHGADLAIRPEASGGLAVVVTFPRSHDHASNGAAQRDREPQISSAQQA